MNKKAKYFRPEENNETLAGKFDPNAPVEKRTHTYTTGAIYTGQWKGGLRHGKGKMVWADGAVFEGEWQHNQACG